MSRWRLSRRAAAETRRWALDGRDLAWMDKGQCRLAPRPHALAEALRDAAAGQMVHVLAAHDIAVHWLQHPPAATRSLHELQQVARARCAHMHGGTADDWWVAADWSASRPFVCAALRMDTVEGVRAACDAAGVSLRWQTVWGLACSATAHAFPDEGWSALRSPGRVLLWHCHGGKVTALATLAVAPHEKQADIEPRVASLMQLEVLHHPLLLPGPVHWTALEGESEAATALQWHASVRKGRP